MTIRQGPRAIPSDEILAAASQPDHAPAVASIADTVRVAAQVIAPTVAGGIIKRRPRAMAVADRLQLDRPGIRLHRRLRARYGDRPLRLRLPGRSVNLMLGGADVGGLLAGAPSPFSPATLEKKAALSHFQPHGVLISEDGERAARREVNEAALEPGREIHELAEPWATDIRLQTEGMAAGRLDWDAFTAHWWQLVRQITLGGDTDKDRELTDLLGRLRLNANWAYLHPKNKQLRHRFLDLVRHQIGLDRPGSLAAALNRANAAPGTDPAGQLPHWLFAFDAAGIATFRTLALLAAHPDQAARAHTELDPLDLDRPQQLPFLRSCVLESIRLWPTTPALLRESHTDTAWGGTGTTFLVFTPFFHRDPERLPYADRFEPDIWLDGRASAEPALVPFSAGPAACPGRDIVLFTTSTLLANLLHHRHPDVSGTNLRPGRLPATLNHFAPRFQLNPR